MSMHTADVSEQEERALHALKLLVAACEQASLELQAVGWFNTPLLRRLDETHDLAVDAVRWRLSDGQQHE
jgi:hypothetical protein